MPIFPGAVTNTGMDPIPVKGILIHYPGISDNTVSFLSGDSVGKPGWLRGEKQDSIT
jgi:hypothetical protein